MTTARRTAGLALFLTTVLGASSARATDLVIPSVEVHRIGDDLQLRWTAPLDTPDGYRVYLSRSGSSCGLDRIYEGPSLELVLPGEFTRPEPTILRVAAFRGEEVGPLTGSAYKFTMWTVVDDQPVDPSLSVPYHTEATSSA